jgi:Spy/CpxP family protein refolding chaperone
MKKLSSLLVIALIASTSLFAQQAPATPATPAAPAAPATPASPAAPGKVKKEHLNPEQKAEAVTAKMTSVCNLNADQQTQVKQVVLERAQKHEANREQNKGNKEAIKTANKEASKTAHEKIKTILTAEQMQKWHQYVKANRANKKGKGASSSEPATVPASASPASNEASADDLFDAVDN